MKRDTVEMEGYVGEGKLVNDDATFFCSELIAKAYKSAGILPTEQVSALFWPACFSSKTGNVESKLIPKVTLEKE